MVGKDRTKIGQSLLKVEGCFGDKEVWIGKSQALPSTRNK
jgi:hypothetical protein